MKKKITMVTFIAGLFLILIQNVSIAATYSYQRGNDFYEMEINPLETLNLDAYREFSNLAKYLDVDFPDVMLFDWKSDNPPNVIGAIVDKEDCSGKMMLINGKLPLYRAKMTFIHELIHIKYMDNSIVYETDEIGYKFYYLKEYITDVIAADIYEKIYQIKYVYGYSIHGLETDLLTKLYVGDFDKYFTQEDRDQIVKCLEKLELCIETSQSADETIKELKLIIAKSYVKWTVG